MLRDLLHISTSVLLFLLGERVAKKPKPEPPSRQQQEEFIRLVAGYPINYSRYNDASIKRLYGYARTSAARGEAFDIRRGTGHAPKEPPRMRPPIQHHDYETERMHRLPPQKEARFRQPMLDDWYVGDRETCEPEPTLYDVVRLMNHAENKAAEYLYLGVVGDIMFMADEFGGLYSEPVIKKGFGISINVSRVQLENAIKRSRDLYELLRILKEDSSGWIRICVISLRPVIERGGLAKPPSKPTPKKPTYKLIEPGGPGKKPKVRLIP